MKIKMFYQSLLSDWNHGNAHFLRGITKELLKLGHEVQVFEPLDNWCLAQLIKNNQESSLIGFHHYYPELNASLYEPDEFDCEKLLHDADMVIVHEFNTPELVQRIGAYRRQTNHFRLLFHDTHHRTVSRESEVANNLQCYDGVLAVGEAIRKEYLEKGWARSAWTWHEAADTDLFKPRHLPQTGDVVWIGNGEDEERTEEMLEYILAPVQELGLKASVYGVQYPPKVKKRLKTAGVNYLGYLPNYKVPEVFARYKATMHVPKRYHAAHHLSEIPTIRPYEAMACGIPLISAPWHDDEQLFNAGSDFVMVDNKEAMKKALRKILSDEKHASTLSLNARRTISERHSCRHRAAELMAIYSSLEMHSGYFQ